MKNNLPNLQGAKCKKIESNNYLIRNSQIPRREEQARILDINCVYSVFCKSHHRYKKVKNNFLGINKVFTPLKSVTENLDDAPYREISLLKKINKFLIPKALRITHLPHPITHHLADTSGQNTACAHKSAVSRLLGTTHSIRISSITSS